MLKDVLRLREAERQGLLDRIRDALELDDRVRAAWLEGSTARGTTDALSDLDMVVVVSDAALGAVAGGPARPVDYRGVLDSPRGRWVSEIAEPLLLLEAPQNAPAGGAFLTSFFAGVAGPQQVDWAWLPRTTARRPIESVLLFERDSIPGEVVELDADGPGPEPDRTADEMAAHAVPWFWATAIWNAKHAARQAPGTPMPMLGSTVQALGDVEVFLDHGPGSAPSDWDRVEEGLRTLDDLVLRMERLRRRFPSFFIDIPSDLALQARLFLRLADDLSRRAGGVSPA